MLCIIKILILNCQKHVHKSVVTLTVTESLSLLELNLVGLQLPVIRSSEHHCLEHPSPKIFSFLCTAPVCQLHLSEDPLIKSHMISRNNNFNNHPSSSMPLIQFQT